MFHRITLGTPARIADLASIAIGASGSIASTVGPRSSCWTCEHPHNLCDRRRSCSPVFQEDTWNAALRAEELLLSKAAVLSATVAVDIDAASRSMRTLPALLDKHLPDQRQLPHFIKNLASAVEWDEPSRLVATLAQVVPPQARLGASPGGWQVSYTA